MVLDMSKLVEHNDNGRQHGMTPTHAPKLVMNSSRADTDHAIV